MFLLLISLFVLFVGYFFASVFQQQTRILLTIHGVLKVLVIGIILIEMIPFCAEAFGWVGALTLFSAGWLLITLSERFMNQSNQSTPIIVALALALHATLDGVLFTSSHHTESAAFAVVLHRLPMGMLIACFSLRKSTALLCLASIGLSTFIGYFGAQSLPFEALTFLQGLAGGSLLHLIHTHTPDLSNRLPPHFWLRIGMVLGAVGLVTLFATHNHDHDAPPLLWLGVTAVALLFVFIRPNLQHAHVVDLPAGP